MSNIVKQQQGSIEELLMTFLELHFKVFSTINAYIIAAHILYL